MAHMFPSCLLHVLLAVQVAKYLGAIAWTPQRGSIGEYRGV